jgi:hypothetical protein
MNRGAIPIARFLASFADVYGGAESFTEFSDHSSRMANRQIGMNWIKASVNWHFAMGINNMTSYYDFSAFSDSELRDLNLYTSRIGTLIREGKRLSKTAVLYPEAEMWAQYTPSISRGGEDPSPSVRRIQDTFVKVSWELLNRQIDFDYIDEALLNSAEISDGRLKFNGREYECVIFPACGTLSEKSVDKTVSLLKAGIGVVFAGTLPELSRENGESSNFYEKLSPYIGTKKFSLVPYSSEYMLPSRRKFKIPQAVKIVPKGLASVLTGAEGKASFNDGEVISPDILMHTRKAGDTLIVFVCNMGGKVYNGKIYAENGKSVEIACPADGSVCSADGESLSNEASPFYTWGPGGNAEAPESSAASGALAFDLTLRPYEAKICLIEI